MCDCHKHRQKIRAQVAQGRIVNTNSSERNWVTVRYYNPVATSPIRVFDFVDAPTKYIGQAQHGTYLNVPPYAVDVDRSDGSRFVLPENFFEPVSFAVTADEPIVADEPAPKITRKKVAK